MNVNELVTVIEDKGLKHNWIAKQMNMSKERFSRCMNGHIDFTADQKANLNKILRLQFH